MAVRQGQHVNGKEWYAAHIWIYENQCLNLDG